MAVALDLLARSTLWEGPSLNSSELCRDGFADDANEEERALFSAYATDSS